MQSKKNSNMCSLVDTSMVTKSSLKTRVTFQSSGYSSSSMCSSKESSSCGAGGSCVPSREGASVGDRSLAECALTMRPLVPPGLSANDDLGRDPKELRRELQDVFPEALRLVATDEAAAEAILTDNSDAASAGYHRQFSEMALREVYSVLLRASKALDARRRYLMRHHTLELDDATIRTLETCMTEESQRDLSEWDDEWFLPLEDDVKPLCTVTLQAPRFVAGMLWNSDDRFLFGGTAFIEEARVLQVRLDSNINNVTGNDVYLGGAVDKKGQARLLLREYISVSRAGMGCMVQIFSRILENYPLKLSRTQSLPFHYIKDVMESCPPGSIVRAFSLTLLLSDEMRNAARSTAFSTSLSIPHALASSEGEALPPQSLSFSTVPDQSGAPPLNPQASSQTRRTPWRQPLGDEVYLRFCKPKLYAWALQHQPAVLTNHTNVIREYMLYSRRLHFRRLMRRLLRAVRTIQLFFRRSLTRKKRAVSRMLAQWRRLELECRERLKFSTPQPTAEDRLDFIVGTVLWQHILTTEEFKMAMLNELFDERRRAYRKWCVQRSEEQEAQQRLKDQIGAGEVAPVAMTDDSGKSPTRMISYNSHDLWITKWEDVVHERFGWFIDPEDLLQESQRRLLLSLRSSILTIADVQAEVQKMEKMTIESH